MLFLGSFIFLKNAEQPIKEEYLLSGYLEKINKPYEIAKIAGIEICESYNIQYVCNFIFVIPANLSGPNDNYDPVNSHLISAMLTKFLLTKRNNITSVKKLGIIKPIMRIYSGWLYYRCEFIFNEYI